LRTDEHDISARPACSAATILVADDEPGVLLVVHAILTRSGHKVLTAASADEALEIFETARDTIHLVISDFAMPGMDGRQFVGLVQTYSPSTAVLLMSASWQAILGCGVTAIAKPFTQEDFTAKVDGLLAACDFGRIRQEQSRHRLRRKRSELQSRKAAPPG
jgi:CheY-like chemotaxis protein